MTYKLFLSVRKVMLLRAGPGCIGHYGYYTPYTVWYRVKFFPFLYRFLGLIDWSVTSTQEDFDEWLAWKTGEVSK